MNKTEMKQWVAHWQRLAPILDGLEATELRSVDYGSNLEAFIPTIDWACKHATPRETSGLVEQQRLFGKRKKTNEG